MEGVLSKGLARPVLVQREIGFRKRFSSERYFRRGKETGIRQNNGCGTWENFTWLPLNKTRRGSPVDRRPSTAEAPPIGKIYPFSKMAVTFEPLMRF